MKKNQFFSLALLASLAVSSCATEEPVGEQDISNGDPRYLSVNIVPTSIDGSRSTDGGYENGTDEENTISKVRFYFFTDGGDPAKVKADGANYKSYYDWTNPGEGTSNPEGSNVSKVLNPVIVINTPEGDKLPGQVIAIINPDDANLGNTDFNLENLRLKYSDYAARAANGKFAMANSVYVNGNEVIKSTKLKASDFKASPKAAKAGPVDIYVERCVAKVRARYNESLVFDAKGLLRAKTKGTDGAPGSDITIHGEDADIDVYIKIEGWNLTYTMPAANISKHINLSWNNNTLGSNIPWYNSDLHRSFWASQNKIEGGKNISIPWNSAKALNFTNGIAYANENAERLGDSNLEATNIIVAATLCDKDGNALTVCDYSGMKFADDNNFSSLKAMVLTYLNNGSSTYYKKQTVEGGTKYVKIAKEDITFKQNVQATSDKYNVYALLTETAKDYEWVTASSADEEITDNSQVTPISAETLNTQLKAQGLAQIYNNGMSYYYAPIKHYTLDGIVRNHIYAISVDGFYGMGTPVYDPNWNIVLEKPKSDDAFLAAQIQILAWHLMQNNITFD